MKLRNVLALFIFSWATITTALAQEFVVVTAKVNPVMQPKGVGDALQECANDAICRSLADAAAAYLGVPPGTVSGALAIVPKAEREGEEGRYAIELPPGYQYCRASIRTISVVPATGDRASVMGATSTERGVSVYTWTSKKGVGGGRSWVEADYTIYGVRDDAADRQRAIGKCKPFGTTILSCRGATGVNKGTPACGSVND